MLKISNFELMAIFYMMVLLVIVIISAIIAFKNLSIRERKYDVFMIENNELTVLSGIPVRYRLSDIEMVVFSKTVSKSRKLWGKNENIEKGRSPGTYFFVRCKCLPEKICFQQYMRRDRFYYGRFDETT